MEFQTLGVSSSVSSTAVIPIVDDLISEGKESFICVILRPKGVDGIIAKEPSTITIVIEDDDCEYKYKIHVLHTLFLYQVLCVGGYRASINM